MAVNYATKYESFMNQDFNLDSVIAGLLTSQKLSWNGVESVKVTTVTTQALNDYDRTATSNRYGTPSEVQNKIQEFKLTKDRGFSLTIDSANLDDNMMVEAAAEVLAAEQKEQVVPEIDQYALIRYADYAGKVAGISAPSKTTIVGDIGTGMTYLSNRKVPKQKRVIFIGETYAAAITESTEFLGVDKLGEEALLTGVIGKIKGGLVIPVPDDYLKKNSTTQCYFVIAHLEALIYAKKMAEAFIKDNPPGISGSLIEGRYRYGAWVNGAKCNGVYAAVPSSAGKQANVTATYTDTTGAESMALVSSGSTGILYTIGIGSAPGDPRYDFAALSTTTGGTIDLSSATYAGKTVYIKSVALDDTLFMSDIVTTTQAVAS
jgi:hypothetical protein